MPELPEVETVRAGLEAHVLGREIVAVDVPSPRAARRAPGGATQIVHALVGAVPLAAVRRGKFAWLLLDPAASRSDRGAASTSLLIHLGMSGQLLVRDGVTSDPLHPHLRARITFADDGVLDFVDQRTFGYLSPEPLVPTPDGGPGGLGASDAVLPAAVAHIARDLLDPRLDLVGTARAMRARRTTVKRALLDQTLASGIGNIYADEALWRARLHPERPTARLTPAQARGVLESAREVMAQALGQGGTSFDRLYVNVNGASGYFDRSLAVYGQQGRPCPRCGTLVRRVAFTNRSSHLCPRCQPTPRTPRARAVQPRGLADGSLPG